MKKQLWILIAAAMLAAALGGCGGQEDVSEPVSESYFAGFFRKHAGRTVRDGRFRPGTGGGYAGGGILVDSG